MENFEQEIPKKYITIRNPSNENYIDQNIFSLINEHKKRLNDIKNMEIIREKEKYPIKTPNNDNNNKNPNKDFINNSIRVAKDFLNYNKMKTNKIFSNIDNAITANTSKNNNSFHINYLNYEEEKNYLDNNYKTQTNYHPQYHSNYNLSSTFSPTMNLYKNNNGFYSTKGSQFLYNNSNDNNLNDTTFKNINSNYNTIPKNNNNLNNNKNYLDNNYNNIEEKINYKEEGDNILIESNIKLLKHKLELKKIQ